MSLFGQDGESERQKMVKEQGEQNAHQSMQSQGISHALQSQSIMNNQGQLREEYLSQLVDSGLNESSANLLKEMLTRDMVLSKLESAEFNEIRWLTRLLQQKLYAMHPPEGSVMQGDYRAFLSDDENDRLTALGDKEKLLIHETVMVIITRVARSTGGWQQEEMGKVYAVSEARKDEDDSGGGWLFK